MKNLSQFGVAASVILVLAGCNIYQPFKSSKTANDYIEEAQKCLHDGDYDCAITNYNQLPAGVDKQEKLCTVYISKAGMSLSDLVSVVNQNSVRMMGALAQSIVPWTEAKGTAIAAGITACGDSALVATETGKLLKALALYTDCAVRMAKTDEFVATSNSDTACDTAGNRNGLVREGDIADNSDGTISATGMCAADVTACRTDLRTISVESLLSGIGVDSLATAYQAIPSELTGSSSGTTDGLRAALFSTALAD